MELLWCAVVEVLVRHQVRRVDVRLHPLEADVASRMQPRLERPASAAASSMAWRIASTWDRTTVVYRSTLSVKW